ncbi:hypothetical protein KIW84_058184 [Lathyrus oleraceus]|uniref:Uncharacterized protein n=1 Tax=Pisum sativum TaxID=3888 RepID=A0A9D4X5B8_PEA|nr:hypothetical protein KIW84_058184 [Pisum sativum]
MMAHMDDFEGLHEGFLSTPQSVFAAPFHKGKLQGRVGLGIDECTFCKEKGHWKAQCPGLKAKPLIKLLSTQSCATSASSVKDLESSCLSGISLSMWILDSRASHHMSCDVESFVYLNIAPSMFVMTTNVIPFYSLSSDSHVTSNSKLTHIVPFDHNDNVSSDCNFENCRINTTATPDIDTPLVPTATE